MIHQSDYLFQLLLIHDLLYLVDDHLQMLQIVINVVDFQRNFHVFLVVFHLFLLLVILHYHLHFQLTFKKKIILFIQINLIKIHTGKFFESLLICSSGITDGSF
jgi:hypothetical protein